MVLYRNRWLIWTIVLIVAIAFSTLAYAEYVSGQIDSDTAGVLSN